MSTGAKITCESSALGRRQPQKPMPTKNLANRGVDELRPEYDLATLKGRVQGKYYARATAGTTMVLLEPDVAEAFSDGASVNQALRSYLRTSRGSCLTRRCSRRAGRRAGQNRSARSRLAAERRSLASAGGAWGGGPRRRLVGVIGDASRRSVAELPYSWAAAYG